MASILRRGHGLQVDHIGISVPDVELGIAEFERLTGTRVAIDDPEPDQWYWSGVIPIAADSYVEVVGPNPEFSGQHPMLNLTLQLSGPTVFFWYIATDDIEGLATQAAAAGGAIEHIEWVNRDNAHPDAHQYGRAILGPGFVPQRPCVIQWDRQIPRQATIGIEPECELTSLDLFHPTAAESNAIMEKLGIDARIQPGASRLRLVLNTPNGEVILDNPGFDA
ncbi:MAG: VOC family protein [Pseudomonadota bacterium]